MFGSQTLEHLNYLRGLCIGGANLQDMDPADAQRPPMMRAVECNCGWFDHCSLISEHLDRQRAKPVG